ncbi:MAG: hypothetical protein M0P10_07975 [Sphaerochaetaceae bacterium]|nr:hypothetical protein [Sphaerochaetaceae bacterium]
MIGFLIKKAFFDAWDNLIGLVVSNLGYIVVLVLFTLDLGNATGVASLNYLLVLAALFLLAFHSIGVAKTTYDYSNYKREGFAGYKEGLRLFWRHGFGLFLLYLFMAILALLVIPFYYSMGTFIGLSISIILIWVFITFLMASQYYLPLMVNFSGDKPLKTLKKCFIMALGNLGTSVFLLFYNLIQFALTVVTAGLLFNGTGITLANMDAFKLLLMRINYLEEHEDVSPKEVPWEEILYDEKEAVGHRTLKGMIFPWKD